MTTVPLPLRYHTTWGQPYWDNITSRLRDGITILDIGAGRRPTLPIADRPAGTTYIGLDVSREEMDAAGPGAYDEVYIADVVTLAPELVGRIDLAVSLQVFEHVKALDAALDNVHGYLQPEGALISQFFGKWSAFAIINQITPNSLGRRIVERVGRRRARNAPAFPAVYDRCSARQVRKLTAGWRSAQLTPYFRGATYFHFSSVLTRAYLRYENIAVHRGAANLATHYLLVACK